MWGLDRLARECGAEISHCFPIFVVLVDGTPAAYYYASAHVTIRPTVHPNLMSPRAFLETAKLVIAVSKRTFNLPLWLIDSKSQLSDTELLAKVGLLRQDLTVWEPI
jgi:hypothetical protein